jgi:hypothetical protein
MINENTDNLWWGYKHINGSIQAKRYFDKRDLDDAYESGFCHVVIPPFNANSREEALQIIKNNTI